MDFLNTSAVLISLAALFSYLNYRYLKIPTTIGIMLIALSISLGLLIADFLQLTNLSDYAEQMLRSIDFHEALMQGMLSFLLFAGALHVSLNDLFKQKWVILFLATVGILVSTFLVGAMTWVVLNGLGLNISFIYCLVFGALISPTDPVAVIGILKTSGVSHSLETKIAGESLFNDGVGVVIFLVLLGIATGRHEADIQSISLSLLQEAGGGMLFGAVAGYLVFSMLRQIDNYQVEVLLTLALVMGGYALANALHISGPLAMVVAGLIIGNHGRSLAMTAKTRKHLDMFWELVDEVLNAVLFVLMGMEILVLSFKGEYLLAALVIIPLVLAARYISVGIPVTLLRRFRSFSPQVVEIMTWAGLRGGISVALALSLPLGTERDVILAITYAVVVFSILVQGLTIGALVNEDDSIRRG
ncbi:Na+/H+ antiporter, NhaP family [hydrothermal vent metagenome]|uniref:Na+/H+ antiporter, NhaP family n=1 Tax=hydrothermal vent metagenome TaxID=652676 RepID=A0A3B1BI24_9ZZZZ